MPAKTASKSQTKIDVRMDLLEFISYFIPTGLILFGVWQFERTGTMFPIFWIIYALIPLLDYLTPLDLKNRTPEEYEVLEKDWRYSIPLYTIWLAEVYMTYWAFNVIYYRSMELSQAEIVLFTVTLAVASGIGGAVGHELFHRRETLHKIFGTSFYFKMLNMNFMIQHTQGHHKNVATPSDPASAPQGADVYTFGVKSIFYSFLDSWDIEAKRVKKAYPTSNALTKVIVNHVFQLKLLEWALVFAIFYFWDWRVALYFLANAYIESFLLEVINYTEHYGLRRKEIAPGKYERTTIRHSWNAAHRWTNAILVKLQRHSDHHENGYKPYQTLCTYDDAPQLPHGYSLMILLSLFPPLYKAIMDPFVDSYQNKNRPPTKEQLERANKLVGQSLFAFVGVLTPVMILYMI